jgi:hypothetical protein
MPNIILFCWIHTRLICQRTGVSWRFIQIQPCQWAPERGHSVCALLPLPFVMLLIPLPTAGVLFGAPQAWQSAFPNRPSKRFDLVWIERFLDRKWIVVRQVCPVHAAVGPILRVESISLVAMYLRRQLGLWLGHRWVMSTHTSVLVDSIGPPSAEVCRTTASFP